jgi:hypothetical protein
MTELAPPLKLKQLATLLGFPSDRVSIARLVRQIRTREEILGETILHGGRGHAAPLWTTLPVLRETFPEWFDSRAAMENLLRSYVAHLEERFDELQARDELLAEEIRALKKAKK